MSAALVFLAVYLLFFPATYAIEDECSILSLASALGHGTVFLDRAGIETGSDLPWRGHTISKYSPFHAALLVPAVASSWRLAFVVTAAFVLFGAWLIVRMLEREGLSSAWVLLYFLNPGLLYYSRTLLSMVPAAVMALLGVSLLYRGRPRPVAGALALGAAVLLHIWLAPVAVVTAACWWVERARCSWRGAAAQAIGAFPAIGVMGVYNAVTTGSPLVNSYWLIGHQRAFTAVHWASFGAYYAIALLLVPLGGWAAVTRRWAGSAAVSLAILTTVVLGSVYYYRDGLMFGIAGWVPGLRFLLPASLLAVVPSAKWWSHVATRIAPSDGFRSLLPKAGIALFALGFIGLSAAHQDYLNAQRDAQTFLKNQVPDGARIVGGPGTFKFFAPVVGCWRVDLVGELWGEGVARPDSSYLVWIGAPGTERDSNWYREHNVRAATFTSWIWRRTLMIARPQVSDRERSGDRRPGVEKP